MKKFFILYFVFCLPFALWADEVDLERLLFDCIKPGDNIGYLKNIDGDILISYPQGKCKLHNNSTLAIVSLFDKQSLFDYKGEICSYETIRNEDAMGLYVVSNYGKYGVIDVSGDVIIPLIYDDINIFFDNNRVPRAVVRKDGKTGLLDIEANSLIIPIDYESIGEDVYSCLTAKSGHYLVRKNGKFGLINENLSNITPFKYDFIGIGDWEYSHYMNNEWHYLNLVKIRQNDKWGILNSVTGQEILPCMYDDINWQFTSDLFICKKGDMWGCVNHQNNVIIPFQSTRKIYVNHDYPEFILDADIIVDDYEKVSIFNFKGKLRMSGIEKVDFLRDKVYKGIYLIRNNNQWQMVDSKSFKVLCVFNNAVNPTYSGSQRYIVFYNNDKSYSLWDIKTKKKLIDAAYDINKVDDEDRYVTGRYNRNEPSFIMNLDTGATTVLPDGCYISSGIMNFFTAFQEKDNKAKYGVVDSNGNVIIPFEHENDGNSGIKITDKFILVRDAGIFNHNGKLLLSGYFSSIDESCDTSSENLLHKLLQDEGKSLVRISKYNKNTKAYTYGYYTYDGETLNELLPCMYDKGEGAQLICSSLNRRRQPDTDINIPVNRIQQNDLFAVIIANEDYSGTNVENVQYAKKDGEIFREYCQKTLGIPSQNIRYRENATLNNIRSEVNWICDMAKVHNGDARIIFYYSGHGIPDEKNATSYLLPTDGIGSDVRSAYSVSELYTQLGDIPSKMTTVFMDACFSGAKRDGEMMVSSRGVTIKVKPTSPKGNMVVFSASQDDQPAYVYRKKKHGMFTYFLLKKLQETNGKVLLGELAAYIKDQVQQCSMVENGRLQSPTMQFSPELHTSIKEITLL